MKNKQFAKKREEERFSTLTDHKGLQIIRVLNYHPTCQRKIREWAG